MENDDCDQLKLIPQGCFKCGEKAMEYCDTKKGMIFEWNFADLWMLWTILSKQKVMQQDYQMLEKIKHGTKENKNKIE